MSDIELQILEFFKEISAFLWGWPLLLPLLITGVLFTVVLKGIQFSGLGKAIHLAFFRKKGEAKGSGDISHFQALMTALSATVGTGNIAGVATAVTIGGPGALFWMWITGFVGMATKYAEALDLGKVGRQPGGQEHVVASYLCYSANIQGGHQQFMWIVIGFSAAASKWEKEQWRNFLWLSFSYI